MNKEPFKNEKSLVESIADSSVSLFILKQWPKFVAALLAFVALIFGVQHFLGKKTTQTKKDLHIANQAYETYLTGQIPHQDDLKVILSLLKTIPNCIRNMMAF